MGSQRVTAPTRHVPHAVIPSINAAPRYHTPGPNFIDNNDNSPITPTPCAAQEARTRAQHCTHQRIHLINSIITKALMPMIDLKPAVLFPAHGYIAATCTLLKNTYSVIHPANSPVTLDSINFIGVIVDNITVTSSNTAISSNPIPIVPSGKRALPTNSATCSKAFATSKVWTLAFSSVKNKCQVTNEQHMDAFAAIIVRKKMNLIAHDSLLAETASHTPATKALPPLTLSLQNTSSIQQFQHPKQNSMAWTSPISTS
jgi:hypothetical protein